LIRWNHPHEGLLSPALFIPFAEKIGFISELGRLVLSLVVSNYHSGKKIRLQKIYSFQ